MALNSARLSAEQLIAFYDLRPLPVEGGYYKQTYITSETIPQEALPPRYTQNKPFSTAILYLFSSNPDHFSALHKLQTDEIWHFYLGDSVELLQLYPDGHSERIILGQDVLNGQVVQYVAPKGVWMGAHLRTGGEYALVGTTMAPGYTPDEYVGGERLSLIAEYPQETTLITALTRLNAPLTMTDHES